MGDTTKKLFFGGCLLDKTGKNARHLCRGEKADNAFSARCVARHVPPLVWGTYYMSFRPKPTSLQSYSMLVYRHALHPEFFDIEGRQRIRHREYEFEAWIYKGGHAVRFEHNGLCVTEVVTDAQGNVFFFDLKITSTMRVLQKLALTILCF